MKLEKNNQIQGAIYGLLVGDAVGVPYEFHHADQLPALDEIEMVPPINFNRTYAHIPVGTWSDDGAQALCLLASLLHTDVQTCDDAKTHADAQTLANAKTHANAQIDTELETSAVEVSISVAQGVQVFDAEDFARRLSNWYRCGYMAVDFEVFDVGIQTREALVRFAEGVSISDMGNTDERSNGNGSLMRCLPLALWHQGSDAELVAMAYAQSHLTHAHIRSKICCAFYCLWARYLLQGQEVNAAWDLAEATLLSFYQHRPIELVELQSQVCPAQAFPIKGSGYVVDCLHSAKFALQQASYADVIKAAIALGNDTDTTACVAGGLAGIIFADVGIPEHWMAALRGRDLVDPLLATLLDTSA
ncbi:ADP-ribosylglycohydrolase [Acinetobacter calcoaceticus]|uniref:ADP-ribosylglycohydrolase n=1 Tax=Acinetobacter calcoaceticus TaxID=471 RepID=A0A4R1XY48_ACICA|nr:ADP-ribosylglycohydrolase [Acinetobacter calcoaceticus]